MNRAFVPSLLFALLALAPAARAQDPLAGAFELFGRTSRGERTSAVVRVATTASGALSVVRAGGPEVLAAGGAPSVWRAEVVVRRGARTLDVVFRPAVAAGLVGALAGPGAPRDLLLARYRLRPDGRSLHERILNLTRRDPARPWWSLESVGARRLELAFTSDHPGARLERAGEVWVLSSDSSGAAALLGRRARGTLAFDGHALELVADGSGAFTLRDLSRRVPAGYHGQVRSIRRDGDTLRIAFTLGRDPAGALDAARAVERARAGLAEHLRRERMHDDDWRELLPSTWPELVADGVEDDLARFADLARGETEVHRLADRYLFVGQGPYELYTEVEVAKQDGAVLSVYVEID